LGYVDRHLLADERVAHRTRLHWVLFIGPAVLVLVGIVAAAVAGKEWGYGAAIPGAAIVAIGLAMMATRVVRVWSSEFAVTTMRVVMKVGLVAIHTDEILLQKVETIAVDQGIWGRLLRFGTLTITGTGGAREPFRYVRDPLAFRRAVQEQSMRSGLR
jgi:uncharacterized membrane protein YdbT with pleckstrin-like domain